MYVRTAGPGGRLWTERLFNYQTRQLPPRRSLHTRSAERPRAIRERYPPPMNRMSGSMFKPKLKSNVHDHCLTHWRFRLLKQEGPVSWLVFSKLRDLLLLPRPPQLHGQTCSHLPLDQGAHRKRAYPGCSWYLACHRRL